MLPERPANTILSAPQRCLKERKISMSNPATQLSESHDVSTKVAQVLQTRTKLALEHFGARMQQAWERQIGEFTANPMPAWGLSANGAQYAVDFAQRSILFWDTLRQRGNNFVEHERQGLAAGAALRLRDRDGRAFARAPGQLRAAAHHPAEGRDRRSEAPTRT